MKNINVWITYHKDEQVEQYSLREDDTFRLFKGNRQDVPGNSINHLNAFYSEAVTLYWVWKTGSPAVWSVSATIDAGSRE